MYYIQHVRVEGFWGRYVAEAEFDHDVNIFIGQNGSGKTTFMDLLQGALRADLRILGAHDFHEILIHLVAHNSQRTIRVTREKSDSPVELLRFQIGQRAFKLPFYAPEMDSLRHFRVRPRLAQQYSELQQHIEGLVKLASLSVHRAAFEPTGDDDYPRSRHKALQPPIEARLEDLLQRLTTYQLGLAEKSAAISAEFQKNVLASILFDQRYDTFQLHRATVDLSQHEEQLIKAYREMGAYTKPVGERIAKHVEAIRKSLSAVEEHRSKTEPSKGISIDAILPLPLLKRSQHIVELLSEAETKKREVSQPIRQFVATLKEFISDKQIDITTRGEFQVERDGRQLSVSQLSSGEKQLFVLLTETLLQRNEPFVFMADEPELSLHIEWQASVVGSLRKLNSNAQVVVATHSPEIAAGWKSRIKDMADVIKG